MKAIMIILGILFMVIAVPIAVALTQGVATIGAVLALVCWWALGWKNVKTGHLGQVMLFGTQRTRFCLKEGAAWLPALVMNAKEIDSRIGKEAVETDFFMSKDDVRVAFKIVYWRRIADPYLFLLTKEKEILEGIKDMVEKQAKSFTRKHTAEECRRADEKKLGNLFLRELQKARAKWGIEITKIAVTRVGYTKKHEDDLEESESRKEKVKADVEEIESLKERIKKIKNLGLSAEKAAEIDQVQTGRVKKEVRKYDVGENVKDIFSGSLEKGLEKMGEAIGTKVGETVGAVVADQLFKPGKPEDKTGKPGGKK